MSDFFEVYFDADGFPDMWHLDEPIDESGTQLDANLLPRMGPYSGPRISKVPIDTRYPGRPLDFSFGYFNFLMVTSKVADLIEGHGGKIQRFPVLLEPTQESGYEVIFTLDSPKGLIDLSRAEELEYYEESDTKIDQRYGGLAPRQKGMLRRLYPLFIDAKKADGMSFFRPWEYGRLIVSKQLKNAFEAEGVTGIAYLSAS
jgi:hypothetical protein